MISKTIRESMFIRPGTAIEISFAHPSEQSRRLNALLYDGAGERLIVSQTTPPLLTSYRDRTIYISFIRKKDGIPRRFGFTAVISGFKKDYELASGVCVPALLVEMKSEPAEMNIRKAFRLRPLKQSGLTLTIEGKDCAISDISLSGLNAIGPLWRERHRPSDIMELSLGVDGRIFPLRARVVRVSDSKEWRYTAVQFLEAGPDLRTCLGKKLLLLQRKALSRHFWQSG